MPGLLADIVVIYTYVLLVRVLFSWMPPESKQNRFYDSIYAITEPVLQPVRNLLPPMSGFDFSPIIVFFLLHMLARFLRQG